MDRKITTLAPFFEDPSRKFSIRELGRLLKINHTSVRQYLNQLVKEGILLSRREGVYTFYRLVLSRKMLNLKLYYNLEKIRKSGIVDDMEHHFDLPVIVLFGSYASATDDKHSDVDICIISGVKKDFSVKKYEKLLNRKVSIHKYDRQSWAKSNPALINSICNGLVLSGELEVV